MDINWQIFGPYAIAIVNILGLILTIWLSNKNKGKINSLENISTSITKSNDKVVKGLDDVRKEIGIGTEVDARNVIAKKYEIDELRKQVGALQAANQINEKRNELLEQQHNALNEILVSQQNNQDAANAQLEYQKELDRLERKPIFKFYSGHRAPYGRSYTLKLTNYGGRAEITSAYCDDENIQLSYFRNQLIEKGEILGITWNDRRGADIRRKYKISIEFKDSLKNEYIYELNWDKEWNSNSNRTILKEN